MRSDSDSIALKTNTLQNDVWSLIYISDGYYKIVSEQTGKVLSVQEDYVDSTGYALELAEYRDYNYVQTAEYGKSCEVISFFHFLVAPLS